MGLTAADVMRSDIKTVAVDDSLLDLERAFVSERVSGFPVVDGERLVGVVSRSDVARQLCVEQSLSEEVSDYYREYHEFADDAVESFDEIATRVGRRIEQLHVSDMMVRHLVTVAPGDSLVEVARQLSEHHVHRVLVVEAATLRGIISALDIVHLLTTGKLVEVE